MQLRRVLGVLALLFGGIAVFGAMMMLSRPALPSGVWMVVVQAAFFAFIFGLSAARSPSSELQVPACVCGRKLGEFSFCTACGRARVASRRGAS